MKDSILELVNKAVDLATSFKVEAQWTARVDGIEYGERIQIRCADDLQALLRSAVASLLSKTMS